MQNVTNASKRPFLETLTVKGRTYHYFRLHRLGEGKRGLRRIRVNGEPGSAEFVAHYAELVATYSPPKPPRPNRRRKPRGLPERRDLQRVFMFIPETGELRWHSDGAPAERLEGKGRYKFVSFMGQRWLSHRIVWKMMTGSEPDEIDHINGDGRDNRFENLRSVTPAVNSRNLPLAPPKHGVHGVTPFRDKWKVKAGNYYIGVFKNYDDAVAARKAAEKELGFHENHGRPRALASHGAQQ